MARGGRVESNMGNKRHFLAMTETFPLRGPAFFFSVIGVNSARMRTIEEPLYVLTFKTCFHFFLPIKDIIIFRAAVCGDQMELALWAQWFSGG